MTQHNVISAVRQTRAEATRRHTALGLAWMWHALGVRMLAVECGLGPSMIAARDSAVFRVDIAGVKSVTAQRVRKRELHVLEVKGTRADFKREQLDAGKWTLAGHAAFCWLLVSVDVTDEDLDGLPSPWGVLRANGLVPCGLTVVRRAAAPTDDADWLTVAEAIARHGVTGALPSMSDWWNKGARIRKPLHLAIQHSTELLELGAWR